MQSATTLAKQLATRLRTRAVRLWRSLVRERPVVMVLVHDRQRRRNLARVLHGGLAALRTAVPLTPSLRLCLLAHEGTHPEADCAGSALYWREADGQVFVLLRLFLTVGAQQRSADELLTNLANLYLDMVAALGGQPVVLAAQSPEYSFAGDPLLRQPEEEHRRLPKAA